MDKNFGGVVWTNHSLERLKQRNIKQSDAWSVWRRPDRSKFDSKKSVWVYQRSYGNQTIEVVAKQEKNKWIILSVWVKPAIQKTKETSLLSKLFVFVKKLF